MVLRVFGVCTDFSIQMKNWINSLKKFNYNYEFVGLGEKWKGWIWRTKKYISTLQKYDQDDIVIITDVNDVFFIRDSKDFLQDFYNFEIEFPNKIIIGAEANCCTGKYSNIQKIKEVDTRVREIFDGRYRFPNGGVLIGRVKNLLEFLEKNIDQEDDQAGYLEKYLEDSNSFYLDKFQQFCGNIPKMDDNTIKEINYWDTKENFKNKIYNTFPYIAHFPGKNWKDYNKIGEIYFPNNFKKVCEANNKIVFYVLFFIFIIFLYLKLINVYEFF